jgi:hypothetical protein
MTGISSTDLKSGIRFLALHYTADEEKRGEWARKMKKTGISQREWDREMELREDVWDGEAVYADYVDALHCPVPVRDRHLPIVNGSLYFGGWDCGQTLSPAFVLLQVTPRPFQVHALVEVVSEGAMAMETFAPLVQQVLMRWHPGLWSEVSHHGDATVTQRSGSNGDSASDVAVRHGVVIRPESNVWAARQSSVTWLLTRSLGENAPGFFVSGLGCPVLRTGFQGAYRYRPHSQSQKDGAGTILQMPVKDEYSHVQDALQYAALAVRRWLEKKEGRVLSRRA